MQTLPANSDTYGQLGSPTRTLWADLVDSEDEGASLKEFGEGDDGSTVGAESTSTKSSGSAQLQKMRTLSAEKFDWCNKHVGWPVKHCKECRAAVHAMFHGKGVEHVMVASPKARGQSKRFETPPVRKRRDKSPPGAPRKMKRKFMSGFTCPSYAERRRVVRRR